MDLYVCWHIAYTCWFRTLASYDINMLSLISGSPRWGPEWVNISVLQQLPFICLYFRNGNLLTENALNVSHSFQKQLVIFRIWVMFLTWSSLKVYEFQKAALQIPKQISLEIEWLVKFEKDGGYFCFLCLLHFFFCYQARY